jgi:alanine transaminase
VLSEQNIKDVVKFAEEERLCILADEVYQENVYRPEDKFVSFKKVVRDLGATTELFSFHSVSKGMIGECGRRGGYMEMVNVSDAVREQIYKLFSISLCSNIPGQIMVDLMVHPPRPGDASYQSYREEYNALFESLRRRSMKLSEALSKMKNVSCSPIAGAMYAFPTVQLPPKAVEAANAANMQPDTFYAMEMLNNTGICVVPGSGFHQVQGTYHFRTTFLPPESKMDAVIEKVSKFNDDFMAKYE